MANSTTFVLSDKTYSFMKKLVQVIVPAVSSLYFGLSTIWGLPRGEDVVGTLALFATFLGVVLGISTRQYNASDSSYDGAVVVARSESGKTIFSLELDDGPENIPKKKELKLKVTKPPSVAKPSQE